MKWVRRQFRTFEALWTWFRRELTFSGRAMLVCLLLAIPFLRVSASPAVFLFGGILSLLIASRLVGRFALRPINVAVTVPRFVRCGSVAQIGIALQSETDVGGLAVLFVDVPDFWIIRWEGAGQFAVQVNRRGIFPLPELEVVSSWPFGLFNFHQRISTGRQLVVVPDYSSRRVTSSASGRGKAGVQALRSVGQARRLEDDYVGNREYVPGLSIRRMDYASWARLGKPIVREFGSSANSSAMLLVDTARVQGPANEPDEHVEAVLTMAASVGNFLQGQQTLVTQLVTPDEHVSLSDGSAGNDTFERLLMVLAGLPLAAEKSADALADVVQESMNEQPSSCVLISTRPERLQNCVDRLRKLGINVVCVSANPDQVREESRPVFRPEKTLAGSLS